MIRTVLILVVATLSGLLFPGCGLDADGLATPQTDREPIELSASVDRATLQPGDTLTYALRLSQEDGLGVALPDPGRAIQGLVLVEIVGPKTGRRDGREVTELTYTLRGDHPGGYTLPGFGIRYKDPAGEDVEVVAPAIHIEVLERGEAASEGALKDIKAPIVPGARPLPVWLKTLFGLVLLAALGTLGYIYWHRTRPPTPQPAPWVLADAALLALDRENPLGTEDMVAFHFSLSYILRAYMEAVTGAPVLEQTTEEIALTFRGDGPLAASAFAPDESTLRTILENADQVKFAKRIPTDNEVQALRDGVGTLVEETAGRVRRAADEAGQIHD